MIQIYALLIQQTISHPNVVAQLIERNVVISEHISFVNIVSECNKMLPVKQKRKADAPKSRPNKKAKTTSIPIMTTDTLGKLIADMQHPVAGIDLSLASPSVAVLDPQQKLLHSYVVRQRKKDISENEVLITEGPLVGWRFRTTCLPEFQTINHPASERLSRFIPIIEAILQAIGAIQHVGVEHYPFAIGRFQSSSQSVMIEIGAVLRWSLFQKVTHLVELAPTQIKRVFSGLGKATKEDMVDAAVRKYKIPCIHKMLGIDNTDRKFAAKPVDDAVDAIAVAFCTMLKLQQTCV